MATTNMNFGPEWMRGALSKHNGSSEFLDSLPFEQQSDNPFKYSKEFMLGLYKPTLQLPSDFQQHEYATSQEPIVPLAFEELTETEKKLLSGPVHSEASQRRGDKARHRSDLYGNSPLQSPANENGPAGNRLGGRKGKQWLY
ncbi:uncharacterized protein B0P05DRAFT_7043 [Gilbertella persicaria]|uniref:uncharacterized protein n=1 Tax=Gilbertella persicaria TaxID=101096 RepID=UPI00221F43AC|nr:uncharacterized protein B0P05DRAFT_7043 [Gilbertella persicaria]KAI8098329.1 hypothetical protein B0P05DRAFT_7043 [Gilbertella persicaria]